MDTTVITTRSIGVLTIASLLVTATYLYIKLYSKRFKQNAHLPQLPPSLLWGHLRTFDDFTKRGIKDRHPDAIAADMHRALGKPPIMLLDNWPVVPPIVLVTTHHVAEQVSKTSTMFQYSAPKSPSADRIIDLIGPNSILLKQNERWKAVRKRFNPGFAPQHLLTLLPVIVSKVNKYLENIDEFAKSGDVFQLDGLTTNLTFDIIGAVAMDEEMNAQEPRQGMLVRMFKELVKTYADDKLQLPWWLMPRTHLRRRRLGQRITRQLEDIVRRSYEEVSAGVKRDEGRTKSRSILSLSLNGIQSLSPEILAETCDQLKTFLFAGHDTTSTTTIWCIYELSRTPHAMKAVHAELDMLFGPGGAREPTIISDKLLSPGGEDIIYRMTYISAVIKEVLRLHPPAGSIRAADPGTGFVVSTPEGEYNLDGNWIYLNHTIIHRDRAVYGETADKFVPERWLQPNDIPASAWRPFERGPRNCIGQELANIEERVIVAMLAQRYEFTKVGLGELETDEHGKFITDSEGYNKTKSELYSLKDDTDHCETGGWDANEGETGVGK
ncbi:hypothetical protein M426DRAFT_20136 [Hypoxylon sp. CI-4A]|nr:hypothetical protein M426DRAFT_20136 [Hypoxylon sp. CI-4A]